MALINWQDKFSVGINELDLQHKELIRIMNLLNDSMLEGKGSEVLGKIINDLSSYVNIHFSTEEKLFSQHNYPAKIAHIKAHKDFIDEITKFKNQFSKSKTMLSIKVMSFLRKWLLEHISGEDKKYTDFFISKGLK